MSDRASPARPRATLSQETRDQYRSTLHSLGDQGAECDDDEQLDDDYDERDGEHADEQQQPEDVEDDSADDAPSPALASQTTVVDDTFANYSQYMARNRSRYSYSPTPASPSPRKSPSRSRTNSNNSTATTQARPGSVRSRSPTLNITVNEINHRTDKEASPQSAASGQTPVSSSIGRQRVRAHSVLASPSSPSHSPLSASLALSHYQLELAKAESIIAEREGDIKIAAQLGEQLMEENERLEDMMSKMRDQLQHSEEKEEVNRREITKLKKTIEELKKQNLQLVNNNNSDSGKKGNSDDSGSNVSKNKPPPLMSPTSTQSVSDFLRQELAATSAIDDQLQQYHDEFTGDLTVDIRSFARRLNAERRANTLTIGTLRETVSRLEESLSERESQLMTATEQLRQSRQREELVQSHINELNDKHFRVENDAINDRQRELMNHKKNNERIVEEFENMLREERAEKETQSKLRIIAEETINTLKSQLESVRAELEQRPTVVQTVEAPASAIKRKVKKKRESLVVTVNDQPIVTVIPLKTPVTGIDSAAEMPDDAEHQQLLQQLHTYVSDVRQQLTQFRVDEEKKGRIDESETNSGAQTPAANDDDIESATEQSADTDDEAAKQMAAERAKLLESSYEREQLKAKAKEKRAKAAAAKAAMEAARLEAQQRAQELERQRKELEEKLKQEQEARRPAPINTDTNGSARATANDTDVSAASTTMSDDTASNAGEALVLSSTPAISAINPAIVIPSSSTFTHTPNFARPSYQFSAIDHFTLTHIQLLLSQMWAIALSLLSASPTQTPAWYDNAHPACLLCHHKFGLLTRRHHCRLCGGLVCAGCSNHKVTIDKFHYKNARVCNTCFVMASTVALCRKAVETGQVEYSQVVKEAEKFAESERSKAAKEVRLVETPRGTTHLQAVKSGENSPTSGSGDVRRKGSNVSPALVPYFASVEGDVRDMNPINTVMASSTATGTTPPRTDRMMAMIQAEKAKQQLQQAQAGSNATPPPSLLPPPAPKKGWFGRGKEKKKDALSGQAIL